MNASTASPYLPSFTHFSAEIWKSEEIVTQQLNQHLSELQEIVLWLAGKRSGSGNSEVASLEPELPRTRIPDYDTHDTHDNNRHQNKTCCDKYLFEIFFRLVCNPCRITKDAFCGCFNSCLKPSPTKPTYVTERVYEQLSTSDAYYNRNTLLLCCAPICMSTLSFSGFICLSARKVLWLTSSASCITNNCGEFTTGWFTYFWSGRPEITEQKSFEEMKFIFDEVSNHLNSQWNNVRKTRDEDEFLNLCEKIRRNSKNIRQGMINSGISPMYVDLITSKLYVEIAKILHGSRYSSIEAIANNPNHNPHSPNQIRLESV